MLVFGLAMLAGLVWHRRKVIAKLLPKRKHKPLPVPQKTLAEVHAEDHAWWMAEALAILQPKCDHLYHHQRWYTCKMCGYEEPWVYSQGCSCRYEDVRTISDAIPTYSLIERTSWCSVHGKDFKLYPISDRKKGPYGPTNDDNHKSSVEASRELTKGRSLRPLLQIKGTD